MRGFAGIALAFALSASGCRCERGHAQLAMTRDAPRDAASAGAHLAVVPSVVPSASPSPEADGGAAAREWCDALVAKDAGLIARAIESKPACESFAKALHSQCLVHEGDAWALRLEALSVEPPSGVGLGTEPCPGVGGRVVLVNRDRAGKETSQFIAALAEKWGGLEINTSRFDMWGERQFYPLHVADLDGDGAAEVFVAAGVHEEGGGDEFRRVLTVRGGTIAPFPPLVNVDVVELVDADGDGRTDIRTTGPYRNLSAVNAFGGERPIAPAIFLLHASGAPPRALRIDDGAAKSYTREACAKEGTLLSDYGETHVATTIICARLAGEPAPAIIERLRKICSAFDDELEPNHCPKSYLDAVRIQPPFTLSAK